MKKTPYTISFILGLIGGIFGVIAGFITFGYAALLAFTGPIQIKGISWGAKAIFFISLIVIGSGILGIIGSVYVRNEPEKGSWMMITAAIIGTFFSYAAYFVAAILLMLAGIIGLVKERKQSKLKMKKKK